MTPDQTRIASQRTTPRILSLWWALRPLTSVVRFMQSGAHPDDETTGLLAALALRDGLNLSYTCSTRGEGGQNDIGTETGAALGALRTREMERACDVLGMRLYWLSQGPEDSITDFGFSKNGKDTLNRWRPDRTLARFVEVIRTDRPDVLMPTFLDVPGQHGHHRAMTEMAHRVVTAAADPGFSSPLPPWQVSKLYLPAWSGAGTSYDDDLPPPPTTSTVDGSGADPVSGWRWDHIGQQSRAYHRTQGMGRWQPPETLRDKRWPLHLAWSVVDGPDAGVAAGMPQTLADLADLEGAGPVAHALRAADAAIARALKAYPAFDHVARHAGDALRSVRHVLARCPADLRDAVAHRLDAKQHQLSRVLRLAKGVSGDLRLPQDFLTPGAPLDWTVEIDRIDAAEEVSHDIVLPPEWGATTPPPAPGMTLPPDARPTRPYRDRYDPLRPPAPCLALRFAVGEETVEDHIAMARPPVVMPAMQARVTPSAVVVNLEREVSPIALSVSGAPADSLLSLGVPEGWEVTAEGPRLAVIVPKDVDEGLYTVPLHLDGAPAASVQRIAYPHAAPTMAVAPAEVRVRVLRAAVPEGRIGYIGAGRDAVDHWLRALGADVVPISDADLASDADLSGYDAVVVGIFAFRFRPGLREAAPKLHRFCAQGGTLLTLYHRPWDNWDPDSVPPARLQVGQPSLRWRITDENAAVTPLADHPVLSHPNRIGPQDWDGWVKERGLYFASAWDAAYTPLLEMADPDEAPLTGALLAADIGAGRHVHCALILHHQMAQLVPGAFRLMANLVATRG